MVNDMVSMVPAQQANNSAGPSTSNMNGKSLILSASKSTISITGCFLKKCRKTREAHDIVVNVASKNVKARVDVLSV